MQRFTKTLEVTQYRNQHMIVRLPDIDTYAHPLFRDAYHQLVLATELGQQARDHLDKLTQQARKLRSHDAAQMSAAEQDVADTQQAVQDAWNHLHAVIAEHAQRLRDHHTAQSGDAAGRIRTATAELRQAVLDYAAHAAMGQAAAGNLAPRPDQIPGLHALDNAFWGDGLNSPTGLETALTQIQ
ncbi:hypothetical protein ACSDR0_15310 [Streptosporangium sp. G11]|uniref:hypothetical protein n=1 Tax=Streptosporangium sp. G11 TaxID=3436926 RepID=UPI003EC06B08